MPVPAQSPGIGHGLGERGPRLTESGRVVVYARVSSHDRRHDLGRQVARLTEWATVNGHAVGEVVTEVGSGLNGKRAKLRRVLSDPSARAWSSWSTGTGWPGSGRSTWKPR